MLSHVEFLAARHRNEREAASTNIYMPQMRGEKNSVAPLSIPRAIGGHFEQLKQRSTRTGGANMNGQLWQECRCGTEPVCCDCEKCQKHCKCGKPQTPKIDSSPAEPYRRGIGQGFGPSEDGDA